MKYFLIIGLMMAGSFAQADICIPLWWSSATTFQVELEAELKGPLAINEPCESNWSWTTPLRLALENNENPAVFSTIAEHFKLDEETRQQAEDIALTRLREAYRDLLSSASGVVGSISLDSTTNRIGNGPILELAINDEEFFNNIFYDIANKDDTSTYIDLNPFEYELEIVEGDLLDNHKEDLERYRTRLAIYETLSTHYESDK